MRARHVGAALVIGLLVLIQRRVLLAAARNSDTLAEPASKLQHFDDLVMEESHGGEAVICEEHSMSRRVMHIVVGSYAYKEKEGGVSFESNYLWSLGLTNARVFWYRKTETTIAPRRQAGPCNVTIQETIFLPNHGKEAVALLDHIQKVWYDPPTALVFLHGHLAQAWHSSCESSFSRIIAYYRMMHAVTRVEGLLPTDLTYLPWMQQRRRRLSRNRDNDDTNSETALACHTFLDRMMETYKIPDPRKADRWWPCCTNGIIPWHRIQRYPIGFYRDWLTFMSDTAHDQHTTSRFCFEYILWPLFGNSTEMDHKTSAVSRLATDLLANDDSVNRRIKACSS
jgi:hypothetical protein